MNEHRPDSPFGCLHTWGPYIAAFGDGGLHICNAAEHHQGTHRCKCGSEKAAGL